MVQHAIAECAGGDANRRRTRHGARSDPAHRHCPPVRERKARMPSRSASTATSPASVRMRVPAQKQATMTAAPSALAIVSIVPRLSKRGKPPPEKLRVPAVKLTEAGPRPRGRSCLQGRGRSTVALTELGASRCSRPPAMLTVPPPESEPWTSSEPPIEIRPARPTSAAAASTEAPAPTLRVPASLELPTVTVPAACRHGRVADGHLRRAADADGQVARLQRRTGAGHRHRAVSAAVSADHDVVHRRVEQRVGGDRERAGAGAADGDGAGAFITVPVATTSSVASPPATPPASTFCALPRHRRSTRW